MRILITGGAGFIGSHMCDRLLGEGHRVLCLDNLITGTMNNIAHLNDSSGFEFDEVDVSEGLKVEPDIDCIAHLASPASPIDYITHPIETLRTGSLGTLNCLELAKKQNARFLIASTSEVYGNPTVSPQAEDYWGNVNPVGERSVYDEAKRFAEAATMAYRRKHGVDTRIARIFNTYGPRMRSDDGRVVPTFVMQALSDEDLTVFGEGSQTRSFCYISDMVEGLCRLLERGGGEPVNLGNPEEITVNQLAAEIIDLTGSRSGIINKPLPSDDPELRCPDLTRAKAILDWEPVVGREEGLKLTIEHFRSFLLRT